MKDSRSDGRRSRDATDNQERGGRGRDRPSTLRHMTLTSEAQADPRQLWRDEMNRIAQLSVTGPPGPLESPSPPGPLESPLGPPGPLESPSPPRSPGPHELPMGPPYTTEGHMGPPYTTEGHMGLQTVSPYNVLIDQAERQMVSPYTLIDEIEQKFKRTGDDQKQKTPKQKKRRQQAEQKEQEEKIEHLAKRMKKSKNTSSAMKDTWDKMTPEQKQSRSQTEISDNQGRSSTNTSETRAYQYMKNYYVNTGENPQKEYTNTSQESYQKPKKGTPEYDLAVEEYNKWYGDYKTMDNNETDHDRIRKKVAQDINNLKNKHNPEIKSKENGSAVEQKLFRLESIKIYLDGTFDTKGYSDRLIKRNRQ